jgi:putative peptide zinc metalloprotease protein
MSTLDASILQGLEDRLLVDTSEKKPVHLLVVRNGSYVRLSASTVQLLRQVGRGASFEELAEAINQRGQEQVSAADVEASYQKVVDRIVAIEAKGDKLKGAFWLKRRLLSSTLVARIAGLCSGAYHPAVAAVFLAFIIGGAVAGRAGAHVNAGHFWPAYGLFILSLLAHEIGHASACSRYGAKPGEIGLTLYFIYPALFSDVSAAWGLSRWQRVVVDLGGVYFQLIAGAVYGFAYLLSGWEPLRLAMAFIAGSCLFSLNPILKFDGYWVVADALGVTNLGLQPKRVARHALDRLRGRPGQPLPWPPFITVVLGLYTALTFCFWAWFLCVIAPSMLHQATRSAGFVAHYAVELASAPAWPDATHLRDALTSAYVLLFAALMIGRPLRAALAAIRARLRRRQLVVA